MSQLSSYPNVFNTCLVLLRREGFSLSYEQESDMWIAKKGDFLFRADNPIELLGLASIYCMVKPTDDREYWWRIDDPDVISELDPE